MSLKHTVQEELEELELDEKISATGRGNAASVQTRMVLACVLCPCLHLGTCYSIRCGAVLVSYYNYCQHTVGWLTSAEAL